MFVYIGSFILAYIYSIRSIVYVVLSYKVTHTMSGNPNKATPAVTKNVVPDLRLCCSVIGNMMGHTILYRRAASASQAAITAKIAPKQVVNNSTVCHVD